MTNSKKQKGVSIIYIVLITSFIFAIAIGINSISYQQAKTMNELGFSTVAFFAADAGAERQLYGIYKEDPVEQTFDYVFAPTFPAEYLTTVRCASSDPARCYIGSTEITYDSNCKADNFCVNSVGTYKGIRRAVELKY